MLEHEIILDLIEKVSPADNETLDQIDARVWCFLKQVYLIRWDGFGIHFGDAYTGSFIGQSGPPLQYTRSRDALKAVRPEGWYFTLNRIYPLGEKSSLCAHMIEDKPFGKQFDAAVATEELAELHAIIQAIEYERNQK